MHGVLEVIYHTWHLNSAQTFERHCFWFGKVAANKGIEGRLWAAGLTFFPLLSWHLSEDWWVILQMEYVETSLARPVKYQGRTTSCYPWQPRWFCIVGSPIHPVIYRQHISCTNEGCLASITAIYTVKPWTHSATSIAPRKQGKASRRTAVREGGVISAGGEQIGHHDVLPLLNLL